MSNIPPSFKKLLDIYKNDYIKSLTIYRRPLDGPIQSLLNIITKGNLKKTLEKYNIEDLYHLGIIIETNSGLFLLEKNEILRFNKINIMPQGEYKKVVLSSVPISLIQAINRTISRMGYNKFISYNVRSNNCQDLILNFLDANSFGSSEDRQFIKQNLDELLFNDYPILEKISQLATDPAAFISYNLDVIGSDFNNISSFAEKKRGDNIIGSFAEKSKEGLNNIAEKIGIIKGIEKQQPQVEPSVEAVEDKPKQLEQENGGVLVSSDTVASVFV